MKKFKKFVTSLVLAGVLVSVPALVQAGTVDINYRLPAYGYRATDSTTKDDFDPAVVNLTYFGRAGGVDATGMGEFPGYMYVPITWTANIHAADRYNLNYQSSELANIAYADLCYLKIKTDAVTEYEIDVIGKFAP